MSEPIPPEANADVMPGAEPFSAAGGRTGALVLHGFTGCPQSVRGLAEAFAAAGFTTELPRLPGHGTTPADMATTTWDDWAAAAEAAYTDLASRCDAVVVAGLSMGGTLTTWLAAKHPEIAGIVVINAAVAAVDDTADLRGPLRELLDSGTEFIPAIGNDIADPAQTELAYTETPVASLVSLLEAVEDLQAQLADVRCPALVMTSPNDHIVPPASSDHLAESVSGPVTRLTLERSFHVATLDYDRDLIEREAVAFARRVTR
jgi:carboxylesterase